MRSRTTVTAALLALLAWVAMACASTSGENPEVTLEQPSPGATEAGGGGATPASPGPDGKKDGGKDAPGSKNGPRGGGEPDDGEDASGGAGPSGSGPADTGPRPGGGAPGSRNAGGGENRGGAGGSLAPAAGSYVYSQNGFEEFCAAGCDRQRLPKRQVIETTVPERSADAATVVTEAQASRNRMARTTTRYTRAGAFVTEVYVRFAYAGYTFERTYRPRPMVESMRFPLEPGTSWSGSWKGKVSGSYSVSVTGRDTIHVAGRAVDALRVETSTRFRGDFEGRANATLWIDPRTKALVKTAGNLSVASAYGRYTTGFATALSSGPGY